MFTWGNYGCILLEKLQFYYWALRLTMFHAAVWLLPGVCFQMCLELGNVAILVLGSEINDVARSCSFWTTPRSGAAACAQKTLSPRSCQGDYFDHKTFTDGHIFVQRLSLLTFSPNIFTLGRIADWKWNDKWQGFTFPAFTVRVPSEWWVLSPTQESLQPPTSANLARGWTQGTSAPCGEKLEPASARITSRPWGPQTDCKPQVRGGRDKRWRGSPPSPPCWPRLLQRCFLGCLLKVEKNGPPLYTGWAFDVLYFISDVDAFRVEGKYQFMTEKVISRLVVACSLLGANSRSW